MINHSGELPIREKVRQVCYENTGWVLFLLVIASGNLMARIFNATGLGRSIDLFWHSDRALFWILLAASRLIVTFLWLASLIAMVALAWHHKWLAESQPEPRRGWSGALDRVSFLIILAIFEEFFIRMTAWTWPPY